MNSIRCEDIRIIFREILQARRRRLMNEAIRRNTMKRKIIKIDPFRCNGCGLCAEACHESAIAVVDGKATLIRDDYCDGLGDCLPACPCKAITFEKREAAPYDEAAVQNNIKNRKDHPAVASASGAVSGDEADLSDAADAKSPGDAEANLMNVNAGAVPSGTVSAGGEAETSPVTKQSALRQWPVQIRLVPEQADWYAGADLLIAADCCAVAHGDFHRSFLQNRKILLGCPKLDDTDYSEKLTTVLKENDIRSVTVARMEVPCCGGIEYATVAALQNAGKEIPLQVVTISTEGEIL
jgi:ferredoxin